MLLVVYNYFTALNHKVFKMREIEIETHNTNFPIFAFLDAKAKSRQNESKFTTTQHAVAEHVLALANQAYDHYGAYKTCRAKFIAIKLTDPSPKDWAKMIELDDFVERNTGTKVKTNTGIIYRLPR